MRQNIIVLLRKGLRWRWEHDPVYGVDVLADAKCAVRAVLTNQLAKFAPDLYLKLTRQTGRGAAPESTSQIAKYFQDCFADYFRVLGVQPHETSSYLAGKCILEYGPGDVPGVALLMLAAGAQRVFCVDRFSMVRLNAKNVDVLRCLLNDLPVPARKRADLCFNREGDASSGFRDDRLTYVVRANGLSGLRDEVDLIVSRAVLEHVNDLAGTFCDMRDALHVGGIAVHEVDLKSHGLHRSNPLDFLTWPQLLWALMCSGKGFPNRWRVDRYRDELSASGLEPLLLEPTLLAERSDIDAVRPYLAAPFRRLSDDDLSWLGMWLVLRKRESSHHG